MSQFLILSFYDTTGGSPAPPLHLPYTSSTPPLHLPFTSPTGKQVFSNSTALKPITLNMTVYLRLCNLKYSFLLTFWDSLCPSTTCVYMKWLAVAIALVRSSKKPSGSFCWRIRLRCDSTLWQKNVTSCLLWTAAIVLSKRALCVCSLKCGLLLTFPGCNALKKRLPGYMT